jgi:hypothetical protein
LTESPTSTNSNYAHSRIFTRIFFAQAIKKSVPGESELLILVGHIKPLWCDVGQNKWKPALHYRVIVLHLWTSSFVVKSKQLDILTGKCYAPWSTVRWQKIACKITSPVLMFAVLWYFHQKSCITKWHRKTEMDQQWKAFFTTWEKKNFQNVLFSSCM